MRSRLPVFACGRCASLTDKLVGKTERRHGHACRPYGRRAMQLQLVNGDYPNAEIVVAAGNEFALGLWEMTGAGFEWRVVALPEGLSIVADYHLADPTIEEMFPATPVRRRFHFQAHPDKQPLRWQTLELVYERPGVSDSHSERRAFQVLVA